MDKSRRAVLKKGAIVASTVMIAGCSGQSNEGEGNEPNTGDGEGNSQNEPNSETDSRNELDFEYRDFMERALINPRYITEQVNKKLDLEGYVKLDSYTVIDVEDTREVFNNLSEENRKKANEYAVDRAPWSVFDVKPGDVAARANDLDLTQTMIFNVSLDNIESNIQSGNLEILNETNDYVKFAGEHTSERTEKWRDADSVFVIGYLQDTEMGPAGLVTQEVPHEDFRFTESRDQVEKVADFHHELLEGDRETITSNDEIGDLLDYILTRGEESHRTNARIYRKPESEATTTNYFFEEDGYRFVGNNLVRTEDGFDTESSSNGEGPITDLFYVEDPSNE